ncbi:cob(I)yrinic acid a,c-diamide adenosyltransferase [Candidatus Peregrinibacteria bacterium]|nr:MAG: cob(I)yrinic acid a,c-diamide adenosyltransferase [Candidatus Peregrinibacteria bacterium]
MLLIITGNGKGKTTSALGTAIRGIGWGLKVAIVFFDKGGSHYGEQHILELLQEKIESHRYGMERFNEANQTFRFENSAEDVKEAERANQKVMQLLEGHYNIIVADEIINAMNLGLLKEEQVKETLAKRPVETHLILTGRNVPDWLGDQADLISEVKEVKHYYKKVKGAIKGIDY